MLTAQHPISYYNGYESIAVKASDNHAPRRQPPVEA